MGCGVGELEESGFVLVFDLVDGVVGDGCGYIG